jgi:hypothetical protein
MATPAGMATAVQPPNAHNQAQSQAHEALAEATAQRDQAVQQARWMRDEVARKVRAMVGELDRMRAELEDLLRKLGG